MNKFWHSFMQRGGGYFSLILLSFLFCGCSEDSAPQISVDQSVIKFECSSDSKSLVVTSNTPWEAIVVDVDVDTSSDQAIAPSAWCTLSKSSGKGSMSINVIVNDWHELSTHRNAIIKFRTLGGDPSYATVLVEQQSEDAWSTEE